MRYTARNRISKPLSTTIRAGSLLTKKLKYEAGELGRNIWLLTAFGGLTAVANGLLSPVLPPYFSHIGLTGEDVGF